APPDGAPEGMAANTVNDTMREMMAATARWYQDINGSLVTGGAGNAYTLTTNNNNSSLTDLPLVVFVANRANSGAATLNVDGLGAKSLRFGGVALAARVIQEGVAYIAIYNAEDDAFDIVGSPTRDASQITTGELDDDRLSSNVPLKDAPNVFTAQQTIQRSGTPSLTVERVGSTVNASIEAKTEGGSVCFGNQNGSTFAIGASNNLGSSPWVSVSGSEFEVNATTLDFNGDADISGTLSWGGGNPIASSDDLWHTGNFDPDTKANASHTHSASDITSGTLSDARLPSEMSAKEFATALGSIRIGGGTGDYRTYNFTTRQSQATWYFDRSIVQYLEFRRHEGGSSFSSPFRFDFMDDSLSVAGAVTVGGNAGISGTLAVGGTLSWGGGNPIASSDDVADVDSGSFTATLTGVSGTVQGTRSEERRVGKGRKSWVRAVNK